MIIDNILKYDINYQFDEIDGYDIVENNIKAKYELQNITSDEAALFYLNFKNKKEINYKELSQLSSGVLSIEVENDK